jgi:hypothetical protein
LGRHAEVFAVFVEAVRGMIASEARGSEGIAKLKGFGRLLSRKLARLRAKAGN